MNRTRRTAAVKSLLNSAVRDRAGKVGVVTEILNRTQVVVSYGPGVTYVMYRSGLTAV